MRLEERFRLGTSYLVVSARLSVVSAGLSAAGRGFRLGTGCLVVSAGLSAAGREI